MFTGIVAAVGTIVARVPLAGGFRIAVETAALGLDDVALGDSIAVDGCCLTVVERDAARVGFDVSVESIARTAGFDLDRRVNLEKALRLSDRLGGHLVNGHVDGVGTIRELTQVGESWRLTITTSRDLGRYLAEKGSITVNGISLTVNEVSDPPVASAIVPMPDPEVPSSVAQPVRAPVAGGQTGSGGGTEFSVNIIPHTMTVTTLGAHRVGDRVNLEVDLLARYVQRLLVAGVGVVRTDP